jgi:hypothetical protein
MIKKVQLDVEYILYFFLDNVSSTFPRIKHMLQTCTEPQTSNLLFLSDITEAWILSTNYR